MKTQTTIAVCAIFTVVFTVMFGVLNLLVTILTK